MRIVTQTEADYGSITASYISVQLWLQNYKAGSGILQPKSPRLSEPLHSFIMKYSQNIPAKYWLQKTANILTSQKLKYTKQCPISHHFHTVTIQDFMCGHHVHRNLNKLQNRLFLINTLRSLKRYMFCGQRTTVQSISTH